MKPLSPLAHPLGDESPALSMRDWLAGARPVAGTVAASALMLLVCGWFALGAGGLGQRHEVGQPSPVRLQANPAHTTRPAPHPRASTGHARADVGRRTTAPQRRSVSTAVHDAGAGNATTPTSYPIGRDSSTPAPQPARAAPLPATSAVPAPPTTTNLPAPLDELPVPPPTTVLPAVTVPQVPIEPPPIVTTATSTLGLP